MPRGLPQIVYTEADKFHIEVYYADSTIKQRWNSARGEKELRYFCGWFWRFRNGRRTPDESKGPFMSESAAYRDAFLFLQEQYQKVPHPPALAQPTQRIAGPRREAR